MTYMHVPHLSHCLFLHASFETLSGYWHILNMYYLFAAFPSYYLLKAFAGCMFKHAVVFVF